MKTKTEDDVRALDVPGQGAVNMDSIGYIAYWRDGLFVGVATVLPELETKPCEKGTEALRLIKQRIELEYVRAAADDPDAWEPLG